MVLSRSLPERRPMREAQTYLKITFSFVLRL
jgi:hypothetical protein